MRGVACFAVVTVFAGTAITACGASSSRRHPDRTDAGDKDAGTGGKASTGGASASGGSSSTGGKASGGTSSTGGKPGAGGTEAGVPDASAGGSVPDASVDAGADANTGVPEAGVGCVDAGVPGCDWLVQNVDDPQLISGGTFRVLLRPGVNLAQSGVLTLSVADCTGYSSYPSTVQVEVNVDVNGRELTADLSTSLEQFNDAWIADIHLQVTTVCGESLSVRINNDGSYNPPNNCSDSLALESCF